MYENVRYSLCAVSYFGPYLFPLPARHHVIHNTLQNLAAKLSLWAYFLESERALTLNLKVPIISDFILLNEEPAAQFDAKLLLFNIFFSKKVFENFNADIFTILCSRLLNAVFNKLY